MGSAGLRAGLLRWFAARLVEVRIELSSDAFPVNTTDFFPNLNPQLLEHEAHVRPLMSYLLPL